MTRLGEKRLMLLSGLGTDLDLSSDRSWAADSRIDGDIVWAPRRCSPATCWSRPVVQRYCNSRRGDITAAGDTIWIGGSYRGHIDQSQRPHWVRVSRDVVALAHGLAVL